VVGEWTRVIMVHSDALVDGSLNGVATIEGKYIRFSLSNGEAEYKLDPLIIWDAVKPHWRTATLVRRWSSML
jgi:hypothetical protein